MGGRCLTPAVVIDLDGTLVATNTFRNYILFASKLSLRQGRIDIAIGCTAPVVCRKLRLITHSCMKRLILRLTHRLMTDRHLETFASMVFSKVNTSVLEVCHEYHRKGYTLILATAAPSAYAVKIARLAGIAHCIATPPAETPGWMENKGIVKRDHVLQYLGDNDLSLSVVITDHRDDLPLLKANNRGLNLLVAPNQKTLDAIRAEGLQYQAIPQ